jgi:hypothetical protein
MEIQTELKPNTSGVIPPQISHVFSKQLEEKWQAARNDDNIIFSFTGDESQLDTIRAWGEHHNPRITVRKYPHPNPVPGRTYFTFRLYRKRGTW